jgi:uridylate kinase
MKENKYTRVILKIGGEALAGENGHGLDFPELDHLAEQIKEVHETGVQIGIVVGGGNIFRGAPAEAHGVDRVTADHMGMLATVINALALQDALERHQVMTRVQTAIEITKLAESYIRRRAIRHMEKSRVVIFAAGTGSPYFSTDTAAALRATEVRAQVVLKATKVDGVYDKDPMKHPDARRYESLDYGEAIRLRLKVMDTTAFTLCMDNEIPIIVFSLKGNRHIIRVLQGETIGTLVHPPKKQ